MSFDQKGIFSNGNTFHSPQQRILPLYQTNKKFYTDCERGFAQKNTLLPQFTPRGEMGALINKTHNYGKIDGRGSASSQEFVPAGFRDLPETAQSKQDLNNDPDLILDRKQTLKLKTKTEV